MADKVKNSTGDISDQKGIQDVAFFSFILDNLPIGVLTVDPHMKVTSFNPWAETLTGYSENEVLGLFCGNVLQGEMCKQNCPLKTAIDKLIPVVRMESTIRKKNGETFPVRLHTSALLDSKGGLIGAVEAFQDISSLKALERERDNIISMFAHDMKSSLTIIGGFVLRLINKPPDFNKEKYDKYLEIIRKETDRLDFLVSDFLEFARLQTGKLKLNFQSTSLDKQLMELYDAYNSRAVQSGVKLELHNENILPVIDADPDRVRRVFMNLLDNAFKFTTKGKTITISTEETDHEVIVSIINQGKGIDTNELPYIFEPFHRGKVGEKIEGFGLGLAEVKAIVEGHGGSVSVESKKGKETKFTVRLPKFDKITDRAHGTR